MVKRRLKKSNKVIDQPVQTTEKQQIGIHHLPPEILEQIFYHLRLRDLLNCRLVHPSWRKSATKPCRDKTNEIQFVNQDDALRALLIRDFISLLNKSTDLQSFPTGKLTLRISPSGIIQLSFQKLSSDEIIHFFSTIASFVTELTVVVSLRKQTDHSCKVLPKDVKFRSLKCLTLCVHNDHKSVVKAKDASEKEMCSSLNYLRGVVENAEALKQISLKIKDRWKKPTTAIRMCVEECGIRSKMNLLNYLKIKVNVTQVDWVALGIIGLKLQSLSIRVVETKRWDGATLKGFLQSQADTLTALEIVHDPWPVFGAHRNNELTKCSISFPNMTCLKSLEIISKVDEEKDEIVDWRIFEILDFSYIKQFPALKQLNLKEVDVIWPSFLRDDVLPLDTLEELILPELCYDENSIIKAALIFPNIKKLHVAAKENMLQAVYECMENIEDLTLYTTLEISIDDIISGVDYWDIVNVVGPKVAKVNAWRKLLRSSTRKSMNCLEDLKILRLDCGGSLYQGRMLEFSEMSGLVLREMESLKCLDLGVRKFSSLQNELELALLNELRKTFTVLMTKKEQKVHRRNFYKRQFRGGQIYGLMDPDALESSESSDTS